MAEEAPDVLKEKQARLFGLDDAGQVEEEPPSVVVEPAPPSGDREGLAREARDEEVETRQLRCVDCSDVAIIGVVRKVLLVDVDGVRVDLGEAHAFGAVADAEFEAADAPRRAIGRSKAFVHVVARSRTCGGSSRNRPSGRRCQGP